MTEATRVRRLPERGRYDRETIFPILDEGFVCHAGFVESGRPVVVPTLYVRDGESLVLHGHHLARTLRDGQLLCVTVTLVDGIVVARSGFHSSINYRSAVAFGPVQMIEDPTEKKAALNRLVDHVIPGRTADARPISEAELKATRAVRMPITEASAKVRAGGPHDDPDDYQQPIWAGVLPLRLVPGEPVADPDLRFDLPVPAYVAGYRRPARTG